MIKEQDSDGVEAQNVEEVVVYVRAENEQKGVLELLIFMEMNIKFYSCVE